MLLCLEFQGPKYIANNYYGEGVTEAEAVAHYAAMGTKGEKEPIEYGLNSRNCSSLFLHFT